jgi:hypothetical protein
MDRHRQITVPGRMGLSEQDSRLGRQVTVNTGRTTGGQPTASTSCHPR